MLGVVILNVVLLSSVLLSVVAPDVDLSVDLLAIRNTGCKHSTDVILKTKFIYGKNACRSGQNLFFSFSTHRKYLPGS